MSELEFRQELVARASGTAIHPHLHDGIGFYVMTATGPRKQQSTK